MTLNFATSVDSMSLERLSVIYAAKKQAYVLKLTILLNIQLNKR